MRNIAQPTEEVVCEECGLRRAEWTGNSGRGIEARGVLACCAGCCEGIGCTCKETGVRRVVVANIDANKKAYVKKMDSRMKEWQSEIKKLEKKAKKRGADENVALKREMDDLRRRMDASRSKLQEVKSPGKDWAQKARSASANYRRMKETAEDLRQRIKPK
jgi:hypothetical protein